MVLGIFSMLGVVALWSVTPTLMKIALRSFEPFTVAVMRLTQGGVVLLAVYLVRGGRLRTLIRRSGWLLLGGVGVAVNYLFFSLSLNFTTAGAGGLIAQIQFIVLAVLAAVVLRERLNPFKIFGMVTVVSGIILVTMFQGNIQELFASRSRLGNIVMLASGLGWGVYALSNKALSSRLSNFEILIPMIFLAIPITGCFAVIGRNPQPLISIGSVLAIIALGVLSTGAGFFFVAAGMRRLSAALAGTITGITPVFNLLISHFVLGEPLTTHLIISGILIAGGLAAIVLGEKPAERRESVT